MAKRNALPQDGGNLQLRLWAIVKRHRQRLGITQEELAWRADLHRTYIADIERGGRNVTLRSIGSLPKAFQISLENLIAETDRSPRGGPRPQLILLDLDLPHISGLEVLRQIKENSRTRSIPVVVLTASRYDRDVLEWGRLGADNDIIKPLKVESLCKVAPKLRLTLALVKAATRSVRGTKSAKRSARLKRNSG